MQESFSHVKLKSSELLCWIDLLTKTDKKPLLANPDSNKHLILTEIQSIN